MQNYKTNDSNKDLNAFNAFRNTHGNGENGFPTLELAGQYATLKRTWWGSNLVILETEERDGRFYPAFNVFD